MEQVFVVRRSEFFGGRWPQGFMAPGEAAPGPELLPRFVERGFFVDRGPAEEDPSLKQLIPYCVLTRGRGVFCVRRLRAGTEGRLHGLESIGIGGHIGPEDGAPGDPNLLRAGLLRELHEELVLEGADPSRLRFEGLLNDDDNPVGAVHAGLVFTWDVSQGSTENHEPQVRIREILKLQGGFVPLAEIAPTCEDLQRFESWSRIVLEALFNLPPQGEDPPNRIR